MGNGSGSRLCGLGFGVWGLGFRVLRFEFRVHDLGLIVKG